jgi:hypothetical protein
MAEELERTMTIDHIKRNPSFTFCAIISLLFLPSGLLRLTNMVACVVCVREAILKARTQPRR